jgi:hypothetical protein
MTSYVWSAFVSDHLLILHPCDPWAVLEDRLRLMADLARIGLLGSPYFWYGETHYQVGQRFFDLLEFQSSHTVGVLADTAQGLQVVERVDSRQLCHIQLTDPTPVPHFLGAANTLPPRCPACHGEAVDPFALVGAWYEAMSTFMWRCSTCQHASAIHELDWRRAAGFARQAIRLWEIRAEAARPTPHLLALLAQTTGVGWTYFYYHL